MNMLKKLKLRILGALVLVPLAIMSGCTGDTNSTTTPTATDEVSGTLRDAASGQPIAGAVIKSGWGTATTDATGNWNLGHPSIATAVNNGTPQGYAVSIDTRNVTFIGAAAQTLATRAAATFYPNIVYRDVFAATPGLGGTNKLAVGQQTVTIKGLVAGANGAFTTGGTVELYYGETQPNNNFGIAATNVVGAGNGFVYKSQAIGADGTFTFTNCEYGAVYTAAAANTAGTLYGVAQANVGQMVGNLIANVYIQLGTTDIQPMQVATVTGSVAGAAATVTGVNTTAATAPTFATATAELPSGATTITWTFTKNFTAANLAYLATSQIGGEFYNDLYVGYASKAGNLPYTVATTANTIAVTFTTATSGIYAVDLNASAAKLGLVNVSPVTVPVTPYAAARGRVVFSTTGGASVAAVGALRLYSLAGGNFTFDWAPVNGAKSYNVYVALVQNFQDGTSKTHQYVSVTPVTLRTETYTFPAAGIAGITPPTALDTFTENGGVRLSYNILVRAVNSDGLESADQAAATSVNNLPATVAYVATDLTTGAVLRPTYAHVDSVAINEIAVAAGGAGPAAAPAAAGYVAVGGVVGTQTTPAAITAFSGNYGNVTAGVHSANLVKSVTFTKAMIKTDVETIAKWTIVDNGTIAPATTPGLNPAVGTAGAAVNASITPTVVAVAYNSATKVALVTYKLAYGFSSVLLDPAATTYSLPLPLAFRLAYTGTDLAGNTVSFGNFKGL